MKSIINNNSSNISLPLSTNQKDGKPVNTYNGRKKTKRKAGGQKGHKGTTLTKAEIEEKITSGRCRHEIKIIGNTSGQKYGYKICCGFIRRQYLRLWQKLAQASETSISNLETEMLNQEVVATDATIVMVAGKQNYIRNFIIKNSGGYHAMDSKSIETLKQINFLKHYMGMLLHNHKTALYHFGTDHAECDVHIIRYLRKNTEEIGNAWSNKMITLLCEINKKCKELLESGASSFLVETLAEYEANYFSLLEKNREENKATSHKYAK